MAYGGMKVTRAADFRRGRPGSLAAVTEEGSAGVDVELTGVTRRFGPRTVVDDVTFAVRPGEVLGLLGPNGAGKTTTIRMLVGSLRPDAGSVRVGGHDALRHPIEARRSIGYMPETGALYPDMSVQSYLTHCARLRGIPRRRRGPAVSRAMRAAGLGGTAGQTIGTLSRGYRQRVGLAQALVHDPPVLVLDEPTAGLDPRQRVEVRDLVARLGRSRTILLSSHLLSEVTELCRRVVVLNGGRVVAVDEVAALTALASGHQVRLELRVSGDVGRAEEVVRQVPGVTRVEGRGDRIVVTGEASLRAQAVSAAVVAAGLGLEEMRSTGASLESAYLDLVEP